MRSIPARRKGSAPAAGDDGNMAARMYRNSIVAFAICLAAILGCAGAVSAQDVKLYLKDGSSVDLYKDKKSFALVIGIDQYRSQRKLNNAVNDAHRVAAELGGKGFEVTLYDDPNLTGRQLREAIDKFVQDYGYLEDARVLIWYAGHGMTIDGEGYLLGVDAPQLNAESATLDADLKAFYNASMPLRSFGIDLRQMRSRHVLLILDSCFAGTIFTNTRGNASVERNREMARPARQIITAGLAGEEVADNGKFAEMFIRAINGLSGPEGESADQSKDGYLSGTELGNFLAITGRSSGQTPQYGKLRREVDQSAANPRNPLFVTDQLDLERGEFFFVLPDFVAPVAVASLATEDTRAAIAEPSVWRELASGTHIANKKPDPVPVFMGAPPAVGEKKFDLAIGQQFPPAHTSTVLEQATVGDKSWLRFKREGVWYYVREDDVEIIRPQ
jgi:hypothetical protein